MSRLGATFLAAIQQPVVRIAYFAQFDFTSGSVRFWTGNGTISWGGNNWVGAGNLAGIDTLDESTEIEMQGFAFTLLGIDPSLLALIAAEGYRFQPVQLWMAVMNDDFTAVSDSIRIFGGRMSHMTITDSGDSGSLVVHAENELVRLNEKNEIRYTDDHQRTIFPDDTALRFISATLDGEIWWGRKQSFGTTVGGGSVRLGERDRLP